MEKELKRTIYMFPLNILSMISVESNVEMWQRSGDFIFYKEQEWSIISNQYSLSFSCSHLPLHTKFSWKIKYGEDFDRFLWFFYLYITQLYVFLSRSLHSFWRTHIEWQSETNEGKNIHCDVKVKKRQVLSHNHKWRKSRLPACSLPHFTEVPTLIPQ